MRTVQEVVTRVQGEIADPLSKIPMKDQTFILGKVSDEMTELAASYDWDWNEKWLEPVVKTSTGVRDYGLPHDFGKNFKRTTVKDGYVNKTRYVCMLDDGSDDVALTFLNQSEFFAKNRTGASNGTPFEYTIVASAGKKRIHLDPPPDANGSVGFYTLNGLYVPDRWDFKAFEDVIPFDGPLDALAYGALERIWRPVDVNQANYYMGLKQRKRQEMINREQREKPRGFVPVIPRGWSTGRRARGGRY